MDRDATRRQRLAAWRVFGESQTVLASDALLTLAHLGLAFQYVDDILGIWGDPMRTGKPVGSDITARKKSLPVTYVLSKDSDGRAAPATAVSSRPLNHRA